MSLVARSIVFVSCIRWTIDYGDTDAEITGFEQGLKEAELPFLVPWNRRDPQHQA
jgi:hypothetical protein